MRQSRAFWLGFGLLCGACLLSALNPCVGVFALAYLAIALVALVTYLVMRSRAGTLREGGAEDDGMRERILRSTHLMSRLLFGTLAFLSIFAAVATCVLTMVGLDPDAGGRVMLPVQLASFDAAFDLWALSAVMGISAAAALATAGGDVRHWLGGVA